MTRITSSEQVLILLRGHLERSQRARKSAAPGKKEAKVGPLQRVQRMATADGASDADIARALIAGLLEDEFGSAVANDPKFQGMVDEVRQVIDRDENARALLRNAVAQLAQTET